MRARQVLVCSLLLVVLAVLASTPAAASPTDANQTVGSADATVTTGIPAVDAVQSETLFQTRELQLTPERPGEIAVTVRYDVPDSVTDLRTGVPDRATVTATRGFLQGSDGDYVWTGGVSRPSVTFRIGVNETLDIRGPISGPGNYRFVDVGPWAIVRTPTVSTSWRWQSRGTVQLSKSVTVDGQGEAGEAISFLGPAETHRRAAHGQTVEFVVPDAAELAEPPGEILDSVLSASDSLRVGDRDRNVLLIAAPTGRVRWGVLGLQTGDADAWVRDRQRLDTADNVWLHEYVHTRQDYAPATETRWFTEASASYFAALFALEQERIGFSQFRDRLGLVDRSSTSSAILADPGSWNTIAPYVKGPLVAGELDRQMRAASEGTGTLQSVLRSMNAAGDTVTRETVRDAIRGASNGDVVGIHDQYVTTTAVPSMWDRGTHERAFGTATPRIEYGIADTPLGVSGPYREGSLGNSTVSLATGETLSLTISVRNAGTAAGSYDIPIVVDGETVDRRSGTLAPNTSRQLPINRTFTEAGTHTISVGSNHIVIRVRTPAQPQVTTLDATPAAVQPGATFTATATVRNDRVVPAAGNVTLLVDGLPVETHRVVLLPGAERTLRYNQTAAEPGTVVLQLGNASATVSVVQTPTPSPTTTRPETTVDTAAGTTTPTSTSATPRTRTSASGPGFGIGVILGALVLCLVAVGRTRRSD